MQTGFRSVTLFCLTLFIAISITAQEAKPKPRVFVTDSHSRELSGGFAATKDAAAGRVYAGAKPQTAEIIKTFNERCPDVVVTVKADKADYVILLEHAGGETVFAKDNKYALFNADGDAIKSGSTRSLGNAVKDACAALVKDWQPKTEK